MGRYSNMTLKELRRADRGLYGNLLLAKLEGVQILHEQQDFRTETSGSSGGEIVEPTVTEYFEKEVEFTHKAFIDFLTSDDLYWTISELKASVELEEMKTYAPLATRVDTTVDTKVKTETKTASGIPVLVSTVTGVGASTPPSPTNPTHPGIGEGRGKGSGVGIVTEALSMRKDGAKHGGRMKATGHAYIGDPDIVPNSDTRDKENEFTKVKLYYDKIKGDLLK